MEAHAARLAQNREKKLREGVDNAGALWHSGIANMPTNHFRASKATAAPLIGHVGAWQSSGCSDCCFGCVNSGQEKVWSLLATMPTFPDHSLPAARPDDRHFSNDNGAAR